MEGKGDEIKSKQASKRDRTLVPLKKATKSHTVNRKKSEDILALEQD